MKNMNIVYHNVRMNLNNEQHRRVHKVLTELNMNVHKSVNQFLIDAADAYISSLSGTEVTLRDTQEQKKSNMITDVELEKVCKDLKEEILKEFVILMARAFAADSRLPVPCDDDLKGN